MRENENKVSPTDLPGGPRHRQILQTILDYYDGDARILGVLLFGSLGRGNWDEYSDLDLDIVMVDDASIDACLELTNLCAAIEDAYGLKAIIIADAEEGDVVLSNLLEFSIRYHVLNDTKPAILDSMRRLSGSLSLDEIRAAANQDYISGPIELVELVDQCIRYTLGLHNAIRRQRIWMSHELQHRIRGLLMSMYSDSHGGDRPVQFFDVHAGPELQKLLANLTPQANLNSMKKAFRNTLSLLEKHLGYFTNEQYELTEAQKRILLSIRQRHPARGS